MRALQLRHTEGHERQGWSSPPSGAARHLGSRESSVIHKNKTAEGLPEPCKQAMPATLQIPREACPGNERGSMPSHTASGPTGCASDAILSTAVPTQTARTSLPRRRKAATGKELRPSLTQSWPCTAGGDAIRMHMQRMHRCVHGPSNPFHASRCLPSQVSWTQVCPLSTGVSSGAPRSAAASVLSFSSCFSLRCFWLPARCC
jgi:hypothetical protein